jgi:DNA-binding response OmpR family regulator
MSFSRLPSLPPVVLVLESTPRWSPELRRRFLAEGVTVRERSHPRDALELCGSGTVGLLVVNLDSREETLLHPLKLVGQARQVPCLVLSSPEKHALEWTVRELGIEEFLIEPVPGAMLADRIRRRLFPERLFDPPNRRDISR